MYFICMSHIFVEKIVLTSYKKVVYLFTVCYINTNIVIIQVNLITLKPLLKFIALSSHICII